MLAMDADAPVSFFLRCTVMIVFYLLLTYCLNRTWRINCFMSYISNCYHIPLCFAREQIENVDDIELSNTVSVNSGCHDVCNNVSVMQQVECFFSIKF